MLAVTRVIPKKENRDIHRLFSCPDFTRCASSLAGGFGRRRYLPSSKQRAFKHGDAYPMNFYLNYWKTNEVEASDNLLVGLLLCSDTDATKVEYAAASMDQQ